MSQAPESETDLEHMQDADSSFRRHLDRLNSLIRDGGTLSGFERNCAFLNTGGGRFANVSAASGLDFIDDARTPVLVDWDRDGDLDMWIANRTAPQLRLVRNDSSTSHHFVALQLKGTTCNRDAVGARVEIVMKTPNVRPLVKTLRAGEGFLGQSTKWMHFGLGAHREIEKVRVRWPGAHDFEEYTDVDADAWFRIEQGDRSARQVSWPTAGVPLEPTPLGAPPPPTNTRILLSSPTPAPPLSYQGHEGALQRLPIGDGKPLLINLWASWCAPCLHELNHWKQHEAELRAAQVAVFALSVDGVDDDDDSSPADALEMLRRLEFPFAHGLATESLMSRLKQLHDWPFAREIEMAVPTTFLIDHRGRLAAIYRGTVDVPQLLHDVQLTRQDDAALQAASLPFPGRWDAAPRPLRPIQTAIQLMEKGDVADAAEFVRRNHELLAPHREFALLSVWLGDEFTKLGRAAEALAFYQLAMRGDPDDVTVMNNLAWQLAAHPDALLHHPALAVEWAEKAARAVDRRDFTVLDTLAVAYAAAGRFEEAVATAEQAVALARQSGQSAQAADIAARLQLFQARTPYRDPAPKRPAE